MPSAKRSSSVPETISGETQVDSDRSLEKSDQSSQPSPPVPRSAPDELWAEIEKVVRSFWLEQKREFSQLRPNPNKFLASDLQFNNTEYSTPEFSLLVTNGSSTMTYAGKQECQWRFQQIALATPQYQVIAVPFSTYGCLEKAIEIDSIDVNGRDIEIKLKDGRTIPQTLPAAQDKTS